MAAKNKMLYQNFVEGRYVARARKFGFNRYENVGGNWYKFLSARPTNGGYERYYMRDFDYAPEMS